MRIEIGGIPVLNTNGTGILESSTTTTRKVKSNGQIKADWQNVRPRLVVTSDTDEFDEEIIDHFEQEGYQIRYIVYHGDKAAYHQKLQHLADPLESGERYAIVAYGDAAALCLEACTSPMPKLAALVVYYPPYMPQGGVDFPSSLRIQIHLASSQKFGTRHPSFRYPDTKEGFAEADLSVYDHISAGLAWSRTLGCLRSAFGIEVDLETIWDNHTRLEFETKDAGETMKTMVPEPYVNHVPTRTGGIGAKDLHRFYENHFIPCNPPDTKMKLLSRTVGTDRIVDEFIFSFTHTTVVPWMLPGIPPTDKKVEVAMVSVVCIRGSKLYHEHIHWDQATVLVQIGLLDPKLVPKTFKTAEEGKEKDVTRLPVFGSEAARKVIDKNDGKSNELIPDW